MSLPEEWSSPRTALDTIKFRLRNNVGGSLSQLTIIDGIRLVAIVGAYILLRPYIMKLGGKLQEREHAQANVDNESSNPARMDPNSLRGILPDDSESEEEAPLEAKGWGQGARKRQRQFIKRMVEEEEKRLKDEGSDEEIKEFLID